VDRIDLMKLFTRIYETHSFSQTARELGMTQPTVSKGLAALERALGSKLLDRNTRGLRPTESGSLYYAQCKRWLGEMEEVEEHLASARKGARGLLRLSFPVNLGQIELARIAYAFQRQNPSIQLDLSLTDRRVDLVEEAIDVAIRLGVVGSPSVVARKLARYHPMLVAAPGYVERHGVPSSMAELKKHRILYHAAREESVFYRGQSYVVPRDPDLVVGDVLAVREAVREGLAVGMVSPWLVQRDLARGRLVSIMPDATGEPFDVSAVYLPSRSLPARVRAFLAYCVTEVPKIPGLRPPHATG
jgi:DNA-binding transcriptional LysR family regulator